MPHSSLVRGDVMAIARSVPPQTPVLGRQAAHLRFGVFPLVCLAHSLPLPCFCHMFGHYIIASRQRPNASFPVAGSATGVAKDCAAASQKQIKLSVSTDLQSWLAKGWDSQLWKWRHLIRCGVWGKMLKKLLLAATLTRLGKTEAT